MTLRRCSLVVKRREPELGNAPARIRRLVSPPRGPSPLCGRMATPTMRADGDVLRTRSLDGITVSTDDVVVASEHGNELQAYVLNDLIITTSPH